MINWFRNLGKSKPPVKKRSYNGANINRLTSDWVYSTQNINQDIRNSLPILRGRTRDLAKNNSFYKKYLSMCERNVVGKGITLQMKIKDPVSQEADKIANDIIERAWKQWASYGNCTTDRRKSFNDVLKLCRTNKATDGETFIHIVKNYNNKSKFAIRLLPAESCPIDYSVDNLSNGNSIYMGVELNGWSEPVAYYFQTAKGEDVRSTTHTNLKRIPADEIIHFYKQDFTAQVRGVPECSAGMLSLNMLDGYTEAELVAARTSACKMGFYTTPADMDGEDVADAIEGQTLISEADPGKFEVLPEGFGFESYDPKHPQGNYAMFVKAILREIAAGFDVSYNDFANDLEGVNFSSMRAGKLAENDKWRSDQQFLIEHVITPIFEQWLEVFLLSAGNNLPMNKFEKFNNPMWIPRSFPWVDPLKDAKANEVMRQNGWKTDQQIAAEQGNDLEDIYTGIEKAHDLQEQNNLVMTDNGLKPITEVEEVEAVDGETQETDRSKEIKELFDSYGIGVRAGAITPQIEDEKTFRMIADLPEINKEVEEAWETDGGTRRPITLKPQDQVEAETEDATGEDITEDNINEE